MASMFEQPRNGTLFLGGQKISGSDIRDQNGAHPTCGHGESR
jgi:T-complex protein 1 subunit alpha